MKTKHILLLMLIVPLIMNLKCKKEETPEGYFFICKLDGKEYRAEGGSCVNCITGFLSNDTILSISGKSNSEHIGLVINDKPTIKESSYILDGITTGGGVYKNSIASNDRYDTDSLRTGKLIIIRLDKVKREVEGIFYFKAYNPVQNKIVDITDGKFRINYRN
jgi:hypothetical protein